MSDGVDHGHTSIKEFDVYEDIIFENIHEEIMKKSAVELCKPIRNIRLLERNDEKSRELTDSMETLSLTPDPSTDDIINYINSSDEALQLLAIKTYKRRKDDILDDIIESIIVSRCIELLDSNNITLQSEIISLLNTNAAEQSQNIIKYETLSKLVELFKSTSSIVAEQAVCALGNIIENRPYVRDLLFKCDALRLLVDLIKPDTSMTFMENISWLLSNLCQRSPPLSLELIRPVLPVLDCLFNTENEHVTSDICQILSYLTDGYETNIRAIMETGILPKLLKILEKSHLYMSLKEKLILLPVLRTIRNIVAINDAQKDAVISAGGLSCLRTVLRHYGDEENLIVKEAIWAIYKMAGNTDQIESMINADLLPTLINGIQNRRKRMTYQMNVWVVTAIITKGTVQQFTQFMNAGVLLIFCNLLEKKEEPKKRRTKKKRDQKIKEDQEIKDQNFNEDVIFALTSLTKILHAAEKMGQTERFFSMLKNAGGFDKIEALQYHRNETIYKKSSAIINAFSLKREARLRRNVLSVELCTSKEDDHLSKCNVKTEKVPNLSTKTVRSTTSALSVDKNVHEMVQDRLEYSKYLLNRELRSLIYRIRLQVRNLEYFLNDITESEILRCIKHLNCDNDLIQFQVVLLLTDIIEEFPSEGKQYVTKHGAIPRLVKLLESAPFGVAKRAVCTLGDIIKDVPYARDLALEHNALPCLIDLIKRDNLMEFTSSSVKTLTFLCTRLDKPLPLELIKPLLPLLNYLLSVEYKSIRFDICTLLSHLTGSSDYVQAILDAGILSKFLECLTSQDENIVIAAVNTVANIVQSGLIAESDNSILMRGLSHLCALLWNNDNSEIVYAIVLGIRKMIKNVHQIQYMLLLNVGLLQPLFHILLYGEDVVQRETSWIFVHMISYGMIIYLFPHLSDVVHYVVLLHFCDLLKAEDSLKVIEGIDGLINILSASKEIGQTENFVIAIKETGRLDQIKALQYHQNEIIYEKSKIIIDLYFS